jgi:hypothetical protein
MRQSLGGYSLPNSERLWSFRKWAGSITGMNAGRPNLAGFALSEVGKDSGLGCGANT